MCEYISLPITALIKGTHNSGTFACEVTSGLSPDAPPFLKNVAQLPGFSRNALLSIVQSWSICQSWDITEQLEAGIRYFDFRVSTKKGSDELYIVHSLFSDKIENLLKDMKCFLEEHPREVVLLDFNHFHHMEMVDHVKLVSLLVSEFGSKICSKCCMDDLTLQHLWDTGKQVLIIYHNEDGSEYDEIWPRSCICSPWPNADKADTCVEKLSSYHGQDQKKGFFVTQGILTPNMTTIMKQLLTGNLLSLNKKLVPSLLSWIKESPTSCLHQPNIIIADFVDTWDFIPTVLELNKWRIPKS